IREGARDAQSDHPIYDPLEREAPRDRRIDRRSDDPGDRAERAEGADELLAEPERIGLVVEKGRAEGRAEGPEEDEARHEPHGPVCERLADGAQRLPERLAVEAGAGPPDDEHAQA